MSAHRRAPRPYHGGKRPTQHRDLSKPTPEHPVPDPGMPGGPGHIIDLAFDPHQPRDERGRWTIDPANIVRRFYEATEGERAAGVDWYPAAHRTAKALAKRFNVPVKEAAGLLAIYSPQTPWGRNQVTAAEALREGHGFGGPGAHMWFSHDNPNVEDRVGLMATGDTKAVADEVLRGGDFDEVAAGRNKSGSIKPKALKIRSFYHLIEAGEQADPNNPYVVIDRHAMSVAYGERVTEEDYKRMRPGSRAKYTPFVEAYRKAAEEISRREGHTVPPEAVQATSWLVQQRFNAAEVTRVGKTRAKLGLKDWNEWLQYAAKYLGGDPSGAKVGYSDLAVVDLANPTLRRTRSAAKALLDDEGTGETMSVSEMLMRRKTRKTVAKAVESIVNRGTATRPNARLGGLKTNLTIRLERDRETLYRGAYALKAADRITAAVDDGASLADAMRKEARYFGLHEQARKARLTAVTDTVKASMWVGKPVTDQRGNSRHLVGWYVNPLLNNDPECLIADRHNFYAEEGTTIGYPGAVHNNCGCYAGSPHVGTGMVDDALRGVVSLPEVAKPTYTLSRRKAVA